MSWQERYLERFYTRRPGWEGGTSIFHRMCAGAVSSGGTVLEIGAGPSNQTTRMLASLSTVHGVDIDPDVRLNDALASAHVISGDAYPFPAETFDACVSDYVAEHVEFPERHLREVFRVLKPGGRYVLRTPNLFHYVALVSRLTPHWFHVRVANRLRGAADGAHEPYPTFYRMNTRATLVRLASGAGLKVETLDLIEREPSYGMFARPAFLALTAYERIVNATPVLEELRSNIFAVLRKPGG